MKSLAVATRQAPPVTRKRIRNVPRRIIGLYRLSIVSKSPFDVDIGGRVFDDAHTLDVFHETPMFIDGLENAAALDFFGRGDVVRAIRLHPARGPGELSFRITAHEEMPERLELERTLKLTSMDTPLEYEGLVKHSISGIREAVSPETETETNPGRAADVVAGAIALTLVLGAGFVLVAPVLAPLALAAMASSAAPTVATAAVVCDPSRTYINGRLFKNLKEVRVRVAAGRVIGYAFP